MPAVKVLGRKSLTRFIDSWLLIAKTIAVVRRNLPHEGAASGLGGSWKIAVIAEGQGSWMRYVRRALIFTERLACALFYFTTFLSVKTRARVFPAGGGGGVDFLHALSLSLSLSLLPGYFPHFTPNLVILEVYSVFLS
ncbi:hypothetical protein E2C01_080293 [Portunus trituberculatus]|uniref:Uncharacterized protein n=1 Tax=Portunus trituberculatus TaxID=210409 RepID=A0A5B7IT21_PORTR|nr:hypothetical protein [Portunus trituberculatus]